MTCWHLYEEHTVFLVAYLVKLGRLFLRFLWISALRPECRLQCYACWSCSRESSLPVCRTISLQSVHMLIDMNIYQQRLHA